MKLRPVSYEWHARHVTLNYRTDDGRSFRMEHVRLVKNLSIEAAINEGVYDIVGDFVTIEFDYPLCVNGEKMTGVEQFVPMVYDDDSKSWLFLYPPQEIKLRYQYMYPKY